MTNTPEVAKNLAHAGLSVFPVREDKTPYAHDGLKSSSLDPWYAQETFEKHPKARVAVHCGRSGIIALDIDRKGDRDGFDSLENAWLIPDETFGYDTPSGGRHLLFRAPEGRNLAPSSNYRGLPGVDIRAGESYVVFYTDEVPDLSALAPAPEWMLDEKKTRGENRFTGTIKDWYDTLEEGEPTAPVKKAMTRVQEAFEAQGNDLSHGEIVGHQHEAIRLGAEGQSGVRELLDLIEGLTLNREGEHSRDPDEYEAEYQEALASGIKKHGETIELRRNLPPYNLSSVPDTVPNSAVVGAPGGKPAVLSLVRNLVAADLPEMEALSVIWSAPTTSETAKSWGLEFCYKLIHDETIRREEPETAVEVRDEPEKAKEKALNVTLLTDAERERAGDQYTFLDRYRDLNLESAGFVKEEYTRPLAWTILSMAVARGVVIPINRGVGVNLWFAVLGVSGSGKTVSTEFAQEVIDGFLAGHEQYWSTGIGSPEGIIETLVQRDNLPSALFEDEGAAWYKDLANKDWMRSLSNQMAKWYNGKVIAPQKVRLKELRGKVSDISFNYFTISTPDDTLRVIDEEMFATGFMARVAWVYGPPPADDDERFTTTWTDLTDTGTPVQISETACEMSLVRRLFAGGTRTQMTAPDRVKNRLDKAWKDMQKKGSKHSKFTDVIEPSVQRLRETLWKCAALMASYRGSDEIDMDDALVALESTEEWFATLLKVADEVSGAYLRDARLMRDYIKKNGGQVTRRSLVKSFGHLIVRSRGELADRIDYLTESGQVVSKTENGQTIYEIGE